MLDTQQREILEAEFLRKLMARDAFIWHQHQLATGYDESDDGDGNEAPDADSPPTSIKALATELILRVDFTDSDGREIGLDYGRIRDLILTKFPMVTLPGRWYGRPLALSYKELHDAACQLRRQGMKLPFRPRRPKRAPK